VSIPNETRPKVSVNPKSNSFKFIKKLTTNQNQSKAKQNKDAKCNDQACLRYFAVLF
jgi:hypothetical protein